MSDDDQKKYFSMPILSEIAWGPHEKMCIQYLLENFNEDEIAKNMGLAPRTIAFYIKSIMLRLKCQSMQQLMERLSLNKRK